jgi:hypothetical protein
MAGRGGGCGGGIRRLKQFIIGTVFACALAFALVACNVNDNIVRYYEAEDDTVRYRFCVNQVDPTRPIPCDENLQPLDMTLEEYYQFKERE